MFPRSPFTACALTLQLFDSRRSAFARLSSFKDDTLPAKTVTAAAADPIVEAMYCAYLGLPKNKRAALGKRILADPGISDDDLDHVLIARSASDRGADLPLAQYLKLRPKRG